SEILFSEEGKGQNHVFFMIDLDYFKQVNDKFGHAFGDVVLSKTAQKIKKLFRGEDILGRIGGDEFVVFMKNAQDDKIAVMKAQELCDRIAEVYVQNGMDYKVTASVGIVLCEKGMRSYRELYIHADMALYAAKEQGRNGFFMYQDGMKMKGSAVKSIDPRQILEIQTFESNISQYVFRILYESQDKKSAIHSVLELMGKHYHVSRTYVFENSEDGAFAYNTFEWCNGGIASLCQETGVLDYEQLGNYADYFGREGVFYVADAEMVPSPLRDVLEMRKVRSMIQFSIIKNGRFAGFIGLDECTCLRVPESKELNDYRNFANILGVFITEMRAIEKMEVAKNMVLSVINGLDSYAYVCEPDTYKILFANVRTMKLAPKAKIGDCCYKAFWNFDAPCEQCSMRYLQDSGQDKCSRVTYKENLDCWLKISTSWVHWLGGTKACLIDAVDITEFKKKKE
ncbi:MAG: GGDEF domain-containing protein, partial [Anaerovorax sp.]